MDSLTQAALGAAIGQGLLGKKIGHQAAVFGAIVATIPDLDVVLLPFYSPLERISIHRGFSHSILFSMIAALLISYIMSRLKWTRALTFSRLLLFNWLALFTHILLDAFTTYGTQLYLPFSDTRISFDSINIVDPVYTLPLLIGLVLTLIIFRKKSNPHRWNHLGLLVSSLYLMTTLGIKTHVTQRFQLALQQHEISYNKTLTVPVGIGSYTWYGVAKSTDGISIGHLTLLDHQVPSFEYFPKNDKLLEGLDHTLVDRLKWFSQDYYSVAEHEGKIRLYNMQCDMQGIRTFGTYKAPTAFYFEIDPGLNGEYELTTGMHPKQ
jgi:inner membrane protein